MTKWINSYRIFTVIAVLTWGCFFLASCENDDKIIQELGQHKKGVEEGKEIESFLSQDGVLKAKLVAPLMYRYSTDTVYAEFPVKLYVEFYDSMVTVESWLFANYGKYYEQLNKVFLRDSVMVINRSGDTLRTSELWWDQNKQQFFTDKPARLDGPDKNILAREGLNATQDLKVITFHYPTGPIQMKE